MRGKIIKRQLILNTGSERRSNTSVSDASVRPIEAASPTVTHLKGLLLNAKQLDASPSFLRERVPVGRVRARNGETFRRDRPHPARRATLSRGERDSLLTVS